MTLMEGNIGAVGRANDTPASGPLILLVEDNASDVFLIQRALNGIEHDLHVVTDGEQAVRFLIECAGARSALPCPDLVLLDLNLPRKSGEEVLSSMREMTQFALTPVIVMSSAAEAQNKISSQGWNLHAYFKKPWTVEEFMSLGTIVGHALGRPRPNAASV